MKQNCIFIFALLFIITGCRYPAWQVQNSAESRIFINDSLPADADMNKRILPYKKDMDSLLNRHLAYSPIPLEYDGMNTPLGNFVTDLMKVEAEKIYAKMNPGEKIDVVLMNRGGLRRTFAAGDLSVRSMYELMPFENEAVVVTMTGENLYQLVSFLRASDRNHPVNGLEFRKNSDDRDFLVNGKKFDENRTYRVLTNDYLQKGGDQMRFFLNPLKVEFLGIKLRDMYIQHLENVDTIRVNMKPRYLD